MPDARLPPELSAKLARLHAASGGGLDLLVFDVCTSAGLADLDTLAASGDQPALRVRAGVQRVLDAVRGQPRHRPVLCPACRRPLHGRFRVVVAHADLAQPGDLMGLPVCRRCAPTEADVLRQVGTVLGRFWPGTRVMPTPDA